MLFIGGIPCDFCKISLFQWNSKYILKFETPDMEQTYKFSEMDFNSENEIRLIVNDEFLNDVKQRFDEMYTSIAKRMD